MELGLNPLRRSAQTAAPGTALAYLRMAAEQNPGDPLVWNGLALAYEQAGRCVSGSHHADHAYGIAGTRYYDSAVARRWLLSPQV